jgi:uncharacterized membrane protein
VFRDEIARLLGWEEHHRRLTARIGIVVAVTLVIDVVCGILMDVLEKSAKGSDIHAFTDALFFSTVQLLTVSSQMANPVTGGGRIVDVFLEIWAVTAVAAVAGSFASFFRTSDAR